MNTKEILEWFERLYLIELALYLAKVAEEDFTPIADKGHEALNHKDLHGVVEAYGKLCTMLRKARSRNARE